MAPLLDDYTIRLRNLHKRYKLSQTVMGLFKALGEHRRGYDPDALGRLMRMSPGMRKACTDTISQLAKVMQNDQSHSTVAECTELIQNCTEMLALASKLACLYCSPYHAQSLSATPRSKTVSDFSIQRIHPKHHGFDQSQRTQADPGIHLR